MNVDMIRFDREVAEIGDEIKAAIDDVVDSGWYVLGEEVKRFENRFAEFVDAEYGVGVNSGTDALVLSLRALGVGGGDEVITVAHSATATAAAIVETGATPVYVDIDADSMVMDTHSVAEKMNERTAAIVPVHLYGDAVEMASLRDLASTYDVPIVEDCAQAHGARYEDTPMGSLGTCGAFSFYPTKNLGAYGDAGIVTTDDENVYQRLSKLREYGWTDSKKSEMAGKNSRLDEMQAAVLNVKLDYISEWNKRRCENARIYDNKLAGTDVERPPNRNETTHVYHQYVVRSAKRDSLQEYLSDRGISTQIHYPHPNHRQPGYESAIKLPITERVCDHILSLPVHQTISKDEVKAVATAIASWSA